MSREKSILEALALLGYPPKLFLKPSSSNEVSAARVKSFVASVGLVPITGANSTLKNLTSILEWARQTSAKKTKAVGNSPKRNLRQSKSPKKKKMKKVSPTETPKETQIPAYSPFDHVEEFNVCAVRGVFDIKVRLRDDQVVSVEVSGDVSNKRTFSSIRKMAFALHQVTKGDKGLQSMPLVEMWQIAEEMESDGNRHASIIKREVGEVLGELYDEHAHRFDPEMKEWEWKTRNQPYIDISRYTSLPKCKTPKLVSIFGNVVPAVIDSDAGSVQMSFSDVPCSKEVAASLAKLCTRYSDSSDSLGEIERERRLKVMDEVVQAKLGNTTPEKYLLENMNSGTSDTLLKTAFETLDNLWFDGDLIRQMRARQMELVLAFGKPYNKKAGAITRSHPNRPVVEIIIKPSVTLGLRFPKGKGGYMVGGRLVHNPVQALNRILQHEVVHMLVEAMCECEWEKAYEGRPHSKIATVMHDEFNPSVVFPPEPLSLFELDGKKDYTGHGPMFRRLLFNMFGQRDKYHSLHPIYYYYEGDEPKETVYEIRNRLKLEQSVSWLDHRKFTASDLQLYERITNLIKPVKPRPE